jgi:hypothetical protein
MPARQPYSVHPSLAMVQNSIANLKTRTGKSLDEWVAFINVQGPPTEVERRAWLKETHRLGTNYSWWLAERSVGKGREDDSPEAYLKSAAGYVEAQYAGKKAPLRPIYEKLLKMGLTLGKDVKACPCKTMVPLYRTHVFAEITPRSQTRIDLGLSLRGQKPPTRLAPAPHPEKKDRITHVVSLASVSDVDETVGRWLRTAYEIDE